MLCVIATSRSGYENLPHKLAKRTGQEFTFLGDRDELNKERFDRLKPQYIFFPHWSYIINREIYENFECVIFHMTDVPFGRGGSPLQNLISRGIYETKISALRCVEELDAGPVYLQRPLSLHGTAEEIYQRATEVISEMICEIVKSQLEPKEQEGEVVCFSRRQPEESNIKNLITLEQVYDYIRMLDAEGYPNAFFETGNLRFEFGRASMKGDHLLADVRIYRKKHE